MGDELKLGTSFSSGSIQPHTKQNTQKTGNPLPSRISEQMIITNGAVFIPYNSSVGKELEYLLDKYNLCELVNGNSSYYQHEIANKIKAQKFVPNELYLKYFISSDQKDAALLCAKVMLCQKNSRNINPELERQLDFWKKLYSSPDEARRLIKTNKDTRSIDGLEYIASIRGELELGINSIKNKALPYSRAKELLHTLETCTDTALKEIKQYDWRKGNGRNFSWDEGMYASLEMYLLELQNKTIPGLHKSLNSKNSPFSPENVKNTLITRYKIDSGETDKITALIDRGVIPREEFIKLCENIERFNSLSEDDRSKLTANLYYHFNDISLSDVINNIIENGTDLEELNFLWGDRGEKILNENRSIIAKEVDGMRDKIRRLDETNGNFHKMLNDSVGEPVPILARMFEFASPIDESFERLQSGTITNIKNNRSNTNGLKDMLMLQNFSLFLREMLRIEKEVKFHQNRGEYDLAVKKMLDAYSTYGNALRQSPDFYHEIKETIINIQRNDRLPNDLSRDEDSYSHVRNLISCMNNDAYDDSIWKKELYQLASDRVLRFIDLNPASIKLNTTLPNLQNLLNEFQTLAASSSSGNRFESVRDYLKEYANNIYKMFTDININDVKNLARDVSSLAETSSDPKLKNELHGRLKYYRSVISLLENKNYKSLVAKVRDIAFNTSDWAGWLESKAYIDDLVTYVGGTLVAIGASMVLTPAAGPAAFMTYVALVTSANVALSQTVSEIKHHILYDGVNHINGSDIGDYFFREISDYGDANDFKKAFATQFSFMAFMTAISMGTGILSNNALSKFVNSKAGKQFITNNLPDLVKMKLSIDLIKQNLTSQLPIELRNSIISRMSSAALKDAITSGEYYATGQIFQAATQEISKNNRYLEVVASILTALAVRAKNLRIGVNHLQFNSKEDLILFFSKNGRYNIIEKGNKLILGKTNINGQHQASITVLFEHTKDGVAIRDLMPFISQGETSLDGNLYKSKIPNSPVTLPTKVIKNDGPNLSLGL